MSTSKVFLKSSDIFPQRIKLPIVNSKGMGEHDSNQQKTAILSNNDIQVFEYYALKIPYSLGKKLLWTRS